MFFTKAIDNLTPRLQRMRMCMMGSSYIFHVPGEDLIAADTLSRAHLQEQSSNDLVDEDEAYVEQVISTLAV